MELRAVGGFGSEALAVGEGGGGCCAWAEPSEGEGSGGKEGESGEGGEDEGL
jgi:hypothetical protein